MSIQPTILFESMDTVEAIDNWRDNHLKQNLELRKAGKLSEEALHIAKCLIDQQSDRWKTNLRK